MSIKGMKQKKPLRRQMPLHVSDRMKPMNLDETTFDFDNDMLTEDSSENLPDVEDIFESNDTYKDGSGGIFGGSFDQRNNDLLKTLTNFKPFIVDMFRDWLGLRWDDLKKAWVEDPRADRTMNRKGARWCINFLKPYTRDNNIITNLDNEDYVNIMDDVIEVVIYNIGTKADEFEIHDNGDIRKVCDQLIHCVQLMLLGTEEGKYSQLIAGTTTRNESTNFKPEMFPKSQSNKGIFSRLKDAIVN